MRAGTDFREFSPRHRDLFARTFAAIDVDHSGAIDLDELRTVLKKHNPKVTEEQVQRTFADLDLNKDGTVSAEEFIEALSTFQSAAAATGQPIAWATLPSVVTWTPPYTGPPIQVELPPEIVPSSEARKRMTWAGRINWQQI